MSKSRVLIPAAFVATMLDEDDVMRIGCSTLMETHEITTEEKTFVDLYKAAPIECAKALFMEFQMPVHNGRLFEISHPNLANITFLKLRDSDAEIIMLDSPHRVAQAIDYVHDARSIKHIQSALATIFNGAEAIAHYGSIESRLTNTRTPNDLLTKICGITQGYESLFADLQANFRRDLCA